MQIPLQITFRHMDPSPALEARIRELAARLDKFSGRIMRCHVVVEAPSKHQHQGGHFQVRMDLTVPELEVAVGRTHAIHQSHEDAYVALRDAFRAARRQMEDYERERHGAVKTHVAPPEGRICELHPEADFGRIETIDGRQVYFHRNSIKEASFDALSVGTKVRFNEEAGDLGPQASTVHVLS